MIVLSLHFCIVVCETNFLFDLRDEKPWQEFVQEDKNYTNDSLIFRLAKLML